MNVRKGIYEFIVFGLKQCRACLFPALFFAVLAVSKYVEIPGVSRYDFIFLAAVLIQVLLLITKIETKREFMVLCAFHAIGIVLELFKTHPAIGSWSYPEPGIFKVAYVPLYSGFMYAAVASYMCQAWRILKLDLVSFPSYWLSVPISIAIYLNFFTHHFIGDFRWWLLFLVVVLFWRSGIRFTVLEKVRTMPMVLSFMLIGFFIWVAENISTLLGAWVYPNQRLGWEIVSFGKISSWMLLVIISFLIVANLKYVRIQRSAYPFSNDQPRSSVLTQGI